MRKKQRLTAGVEAELVPDVAHARVPIVGVMATARIKTKVAVGRRRNPRRSARVLGDSNRRDVASHGGAGAAARAADGEGVAVGVACLARGWVDCAGAGGELRDVGAPEDDPVLFLDEGREVCVSDLVSVVRASD